ncbi:MAG: ferrous iron transporter B [Planctomycetota bacterium]|nr:ferrous iron transporter B [Planctomycetota bacterium]
MTAAPNDATASAPAHDPAPVAAAPACFGMLGNPNTGKTTLFNRLCGIRAKTANFPGSTVEARIGNVTIDHQLGRIVDLPGVYALHLDRPESRVCREYLAGDISLGPPPEAVVIVADAMNLQRNLVFIAQALQEGLPAVVAVNMTDLAARAGLRIDTDELAGRLGCPVVSVSARSGRGVDRLVQAMRRPVRSTMSFPDPRDSLGAWNWAEEVYEDCVHRDPALSAASDALTDRLDHVLTHPVLGLLVFAAVMTGLFYTIFSLAGVPMELIELLLGRLGGAVGALLPQGALHDLVVDGIIGGIAGTLVFLPQICLLFFLISLLEDTGYLARAAFVLDRIMRRFGLPGQAFVPLLSAHACAIPAIMSARLIPDRRDRLATVLVAPFLSCSARLPVYVLLVGILFGDRPLAAGLAFAGCYVLGATAALLTALLARHTVLRGPSRPMVLELPTYKIPSLRTALLVMVDRGWLFLRKAGTVILGICIVLWWLSAYPKAPEPSEATALRDRGEALIDSEPQEARAMIEEADQIATEHALAHSFAGRIGHGVAPLFEPIGLNWQLTVGVITSFAAREVFVSTLSVLFAGADDVEDAAVLERIRSAKREDGSPLFTTATAASLLVFFVLAMQCLPTLAVTAREAGGWRWALLQLGYMSGVAYLAAFITYLSLGGGG